MVQYTHRPAHRAQAQKGKQMAAVQVYEVEEVADKRRAFADFYGMEAS